MTHLSSNVDRNPGTPSENLVKDTNGRWLIGIWGKWLLWYWYHHWHNVIEMAMTHILLSEGEEGMQNRAEITILLFFLQLVLKYWILLRMNWW